MPDLTSKTGVLSENVISAVMTAFLLIQEYAGRLVMMNGTTVHNLPSGRSIIRVSTTRVDIAAKLNGVIAKEKGNAVAQLDGNFIARRCITLALSDRKTTRRLQGR